MAQRDAAILINGTGATCLIYDGKNLSFPPSSFSETNGNLIILNNKVQDYFQTKLSHHSINLEKNDVIIIGLGIDPQIARLATLNAALTLF